MFLYLMKSQQFYKIGVAQNIWKRREGLATGNPNEIQIVFAFWFPNDSMAVYKAEEELHVMFADKRVRGEWFELSENDVWKFLWTTEKELGGVQPIHPPLVFQRGTL